MPKTILFLVAVALSFCSLSQNKVDWKVDYDPLTETVVFSASIDEGWHLYSQKINEEIGPVPTTFTFEKSKQFKLIGKTEEPTPITEFDPNFDGELSYFKNSVEFTQKIKVKDTAEVKGVITFMVCTDSMCLPPVTIDFNLTIDKNEK